MAQTKADLLFEVSWEVCNKVGGIWTVLSSKASQMQKHYSKEDYICIGPYVAREAIGNFEEHPAPEKCKKLCKNLENQGIVLHFGNWLIKGEPRAILIDFANFRFKTDDIKKELWETYKIDSLRSNNVEYNEPIVWAWAAGKIIEAMAGLYPEKKVAAQFHEWLAGPGLLYLKKNKAKVATVFTTHATVLGRSLASRDIDLFAKQKDSGQLNIQMIDIDKKAYEFGVEGKHQIEKVSAQNSEIFSTVSEITSMEAEHIIQRKPDNILPNGLDSNKFPTFEEASVEHRRHRDIMREFVMYYFFPYYQFDIKDTLFFYLAGRYEFRNKGIDIYIRALSRLNDLMKKEKSKKTIVAFIFVPTDTRGIKLDILENRALFNDIKDALDEESGSIKKNMLYTLASRSELTKENIFSSNFLEETKRRSMKFKKKGTPPLVTHDLQNYGDSIVDLMINSGLDNKEDDKVKVIFYPIYLTGADGLLDMTYYEALQAGHLGVFPSFYEPWGYTPLEAAALGVSSVTTDLAGFGRFIMKKNEQKYPGVFVLRRMNKKDEEIVDDLAKFMHRFTKFTKHDRVKNKIEAKNIAGKADWKKLSLNYIKAQNNAVKMIAER